MLLGKKKFILIGALAVLFLSIGVVVYGVISLFGSNSQTINNTKGRHFSVELSDVTTGVEVLPGTEISLTPKVDNTSLTEYIYVFIEFRYDKDVYEITNVSGWEVVSNEGNSTVYSYSTSGTMNSVTLGNSAIFSGTLRVISTGEAFRALTNDDLQVVVIGYGISVDIARSDKLEAWQDYATGGNATMLAAINNSQNSGNNNEDPDNKDDMD